MDICFSLLYCKFLEEENYSADFSYEAFFGEYVYGDL